MATPPSPSSAPTVTVIVAVHDVAGQVAAAIDSLRAQSLTEFEAVVIDDGSTDDSGAVARQAIAGDPRFRMVRTLNHGLGAARNIGLTLARGEWLAFLDGDDALQPGFLEALLRAAQGAGQPWAMSALGLWPGHGSGVPHSGIHGSPDPAPMEPRVIPLEDARQVARLFPSAWGKLYHRTLFDRLRFPEATWYEDHELFWQIAARAGAILHLPQPLYLHRRDRPGQITAADDDRVFQQFEVLDRLQPLIGGFAHAREGAQQLASRLIHERAAVLHHPPRRAAFVARAQDWLAGQGLRFDPATDGGLSPVLAFVMAKEAACSVIRPAEAGENGADEARPVWQRDAATLHGEAQAQDMAGLAGRAGSRYLLIAPPSSQPHAPGIEPLLEAGLKGDADLVLGQFQTRRTGGDWGHHDGWMDNRLVAPHPAQLSPAGGPLTLSSAAALRLHPSPARMLIRADLMGRIGALSVPLGHPMAAAELVLRAALAAQAVLALPLPVARITPNAPPTGMVLDWAAGLEMPGDADMPPGWRTILALRALRPGLPPVRSLGGIRARLALGRALRRAGLVAPGGAGGAATADPGTDRLLARLAGLRVDPG